MMPTVMLSWCGSIPPIDGVIMKVSCWLLALPVGPGTAGALRQIRVEFDRLPSRQERPCRSHTRHDTSDNRHEANERVESAPSAEPDRNPRAEGAGRSRM